MPYCDDDSKRGAREDGPETAGELNYLLTKQVIQYLRIHGLSYSTINDVLGALDGCAREFYDRVARPYEDDCIAVNGDQYPVGFTSGRPNKGIPRG